MLFNFISILLLIGSLVAARWWIRSYHTWDRFITSWPAQGMGIGSASGMIVINIRLTHEYRIERSMGWSSSPPEGWDLGNGEILITEDDPLHHSSFRMRDPRSFTWETAYLNPPENLRFSDLPGAQPVVGDQFVRIRFPFWTAVPALGFIPAVRLGRKSIRMVRHVMTSARTKQRDQRIAAGLCPNCSYDIRATPDLCPECGKSPKLQS